MMNKQVMPRESHIFFHKNMVKVIRCKDCVFGKNTEQEGWVHCGLTGRLMSVLGYCSEALYEGEDEKSKKEGGFC